VFPLECIVYDNAWHLKKYCINPTRKLLMPVEQRLSAMDMVVDKNARLEIMLTVGLRQTATHMIALI